MDFAVTLQLTSQKKQSIKLIPFQHSWAAPETGEQRIVKFKFNLDSNWHILQFFSVQKKEALKQQATATKSFQLFPHLFFPALLCLIAHSL